MTGWRRLPSWVPVAIESGYLDWSDVRHLVLGTSRRAQAFGRACDDVARSPLPLSRTLAFVVFFVGLVLLAGGVR